MVGFLFDQLLCKILYTDRYFKGKSNHPRQGNFKYFAGAAACLHWGIYPLSMAIGCMQCKQSWGFRQPSPSHSTYLLYLFTIKLYYNLPTHLYHLLYIFITIILSLFDVAIAITFVVLLPSFSNHLLYILPSHLTLLER